MKYAFKYFSFFLWNKCVKKTGVLGDRLSALSSVYEYMQWNAFGNMKYICSQSFSPLILEPGPVHTKPSFYR